MQSGDLSLLYRKPERPDPQAVEDATKTEKQIPITEFLTPLKAQLSRVNNTAEKIEANF